MAGMPAASAAPAMGLPGEDGKSLAEMAQRDLDAALQLLADRAVYITKSTGAAIALRRKDKDKNDMLCRASTGRSAPALGALFSAEIGLSGESVRTRRVLRCDDAERDPRVNREVCREMGIASVVVMPVVNDDQVLGVFELFSGKPNAFGDRDVSALQRLSEMVETAVKLAHAAETLPPSLLGETSPPTVQAGQPKPPVAKVETIKIDAGNIETTRVDTAQFLEPKIEATPTKPETDSASPPSKKPLLWSAVASASTDTAKPADAPQLADQSRIPPVLRNLRKCEACGFPVSAGRALCVECEEKKWRGQLRRNSPLPNVPDRVASQAASTSGTSTQGASASESSAPVSRLQTAAKSVAGSSAAAPAPARAPETIQGTFVADFPIVPQKPPAQERPASAKPVSASVSVPKPVPAPTPASFPRVAAPELILSAAVAPSQSWISANKYILGALAVVAGTVAAILLLR